MFFVDACQALEYALQSSFSMQCLWNHYDNNVCLAWNFSFVPVDISDGGNKKQKKHLNYIKTFLKKKEKRSIFPEALVLIVSAFRAEVMTIITSQCIYFSLSVSVNTAVVERRRLWRDFSHGWAVIRLKTSSNTSCFYGDFLCRKYTVDSVKRNRLERSDMFTVYFQKNDPFISPEKTVCMDRREACFLFKLKTWAECLCSKITVPWMKIRIQRQPGAVSLTTVVEPLSKKPHPSGVFSCGYVQRLLFLSVSLCPSILQNQPFISEINYLIVAWGNNMDIPEM